MNKCQLFNPMYMEAKCRQCGEWAEPICANCQSFVCQKCHPKPSLLLRLQLWLIKKAYQR